MIDLPSAPLAGTSRFIRYGFMPNRLRYCGGDDNRTLFEFGPLNLADGGLEALLRRFTGALPYLQLIARPTGSPTRSTAGWSRPTGWGMSCLSASKCASSTTL